jgi:hypothetical protein
VSGWLFTLTAGGLLLFCGLKGYKLLPAIQGQLEPLPSLNWAEVLGTIFAAFAAKTALSALGSSLGARIGSRVGTTAPRTTEPNIRRTPVEPAQPRQLPRGGAQRAIPRIAGE